MCGEKLMLIYGHRFIPSQSFYHVSDIDSISNTPPSSVVHIEFNEDNLDIINHANINQIPISLCAKNIRDIIYSSALEASFIIVHKELAEDAKNLANEYLYDAKILVLIEEENEIEELATVGVDGVIFSNAIIKTNS